MLPIARKIEYDTFSHDGMFTVSANGTLVYGTAGAGVNTELTGMDRNGKTLGVLGEPGQFFRHSISPDGGRIAVGRKAHGLAGKDLDLRRREGNPHFSCE
jgi:hypothetical protein